MLFKSLLFLCAGAIIHLVHSNNMMDMGGLRKTMPVTHISFLAACLAISGIPPFSGFFSKEDILLAAYHANKLVYTVAVCTSALTAFYMFRLYFSIFWNITRHRARQVTERPASHENSDDYSCCMLGSWWFVPIAPW
jgi:NADH-quinone oxidoreductase subunit L